MSNISDVEESSVSLTSSSKESSESSESQDGDNDEKEHESDNEQLSYLDLAIEPKGNKLKPDDHMFIATPEK